MYGKLDDEKKFFPWILKSLEQGAEINLTKGGQLRDFIYIDDVVSAYMITIQKAKQLQKFNEFDVGTGVLTSVRTLVETMRVIYEKKYCKSNSRIFLVQYHIGMGK